MPASLSRMSDGIVISVNSAYVRMFGVAASAAIGSVPSAAGIVVDRGSRDDVFHRLRSGEEVAGVETTIHSPAGTLELLLWSRREIIDDVDVAMTTFIDVTARNRAQRGMRESEDRLREVVDNIHEVTWLTDAANSQTLYISPAYEKIFGARPSRCTPTRDPGSWPFTPTTASACVRGAGPPTRVSPRAIECSDPMAACARSSSRRSRFAMRAVR